MKHIRDITASHRKHLAEQIVLARMLGEPWKEIARRHGIHRITAMRLAQQHIQSVNSREILPGCNIVQRQTTPQISEGVEDSET